MLVSFYNANFIYYNYIHVYVLNNKCDLQVESMYSLKILFHFHGIVHEISPIFRPRSQNRCAHRN